MVFSWDKHSFYLTHRLTPFCTKINLRENRIFRSNERLVDKNSTHCVKVCAENKTNWAAGELTGVLVGENVSSIQTELNLENLCGLSILTKTSQRQCEIFSFSPTTALW